MKYFQSKLDNKILLYSILLIILFFIIILPLFNYENYKDQQLLNEEFDNLINSIDNKNLIINNKPSLDNPDNLVLIDKNICSKSCCKFTQWPVPFNTVNPNISKDVLDEFVGSNFTCNGGPDAGGCVCMKKQDLTYLTNQGQIENKNE